MSYDFRTVQIDEIRENPVALRAVDKECEQYQSLRSDIAKRGILKPVLVREKTDEVTGESYFELCDGLQRFSSAKDNGISEIPISVQSMDDAEIEETQIVANLCKVDTKPVEYTNQLKRMMQRNPTMTVAEVADRISQSPAFVVKRLSLLKLDDSIQNLLDEGQINVSNAYALAKLPREEQHHWTDAAMTQSPSEFIEAVNARVKEIREAKRQGKEAGEKKFVPTPKLRKLKELKSEKETPSVGPALVAETGVTTAAEGFALGVAWALSLDPPTVAEAEQKYQEQLEKREAEKARRKAEREKKRAEEAARKAAEAEEAAANA